MAIQQDPKPIPCGTSGKISSDSNDIARSFVGTAQEYSKLYDNALKNAFIYAQYAAWTKAECGGKCHPWVSDVTVEIVSVEYSLQTFWTIFSLHMQYECIITYKWKATITCEPNPMPAYYTAPHAIE